MPKRKNNYKVPDNIFIDAIKTSKSIRETILKLGLTETGSAYRIFKQRAKNLNINIDHLLGKGYLKGRTHNWALQIPIEEILIIDSSYTNTTSLRKKLLKLKLVMDQCAECGLTSEWNNKPITLQLDHKNGIHNDNRLENLRLLCPNCHSQTDTFGGKNIK